MLITCWLTLVLHQICRAIAQTPSAPPLPAKVWGSKYSSCDDDSVTSQSLDRCGIRIRFLKWLHVCGCVSEDRFTAGGLKSSSLQFHSWQKQHHLFFQLTGPVTYSLIGPQNEPRQSCQLSAWSWWSWQAAVTGCTLFKFTMLHSECGNDSEMEEEMLMVMLFAKFIICTGISVVDLLVVCDWWTNLCRVMSSGHWSSHTITCPVCTSSCSDVG